MAYLKARDRLTREAEEEMAVLGSVCTPRVWEDRGCEVLAVDLV